MKNYNYKTYWVKRGITYLQEFEHNDNFATQEYELIKLLKTLEFKTVFEVGCGFGRITELINNNFIIEKYDAIDISEEQIKNARVKNPGVNFLVGDLLKYDTPLKYDLVIASELLMHLPPNLITETIIKLISITKKDLVHIDYYRDNHQLAKHNFKHDYQSIYNNLGYSISIIPLDFGQSIFNIKKD